MHSGFDDDPGNTFNDDFNDGLHTEGYKEEGRVLWLIIF